MGTTSCLLGRVLGCDNRIRTILRDPRTIVYLSRNDCERQLCHANWTTAPLTAQVGFVPLSRPLSLSTARHDPLKTSDDRFEPKMQDAPAQTDVRSAPLRAAVTLRQAFEGLHQRSFARLLRRALLETFLSSHLRRNIPRPNGSPICRELLRDVG